MVGSCAQALKPHHSEHSHGLRTRSVPASHMSSEPVQPEVSTIVVRGERFVLARPDDLLRLAQLLHGAPREAVHSDGPPAVSLTFHRDPRLFKIVQTYPAGYPILPLAVT